MSLGLLYLIVLGIAGLGFFVGRSRALAVVGGDGRKLHSLPSYHGQSVALFAALPAFFVFGVWLFVQPILIEGSISATIPDSVIPEGGALSLVMADVRRIADGLDALVQAGSLTEASIAQLSSTGNTDIRAMLAAGGVALGSDVPQAVLVAATEYRTLSGAGRLAMTGLVLVLAVLGLVLSLRRITPELRARNISEAFVKA
ncbi:MAG: phosphate ABC transporter permease family protein, partial [Lutimaribacter sp.]